MMMINIIPIVTLCTALFGGGSTTIRNKNAAVSPFVSSSSSVLAATMILPAATAAAATTIIPSTPKKTKKSVVFVYSPPPEVEILPTMTSFDDMFDDLDATEPVSAFKIFTYSLKNAAKGLCSDAKQLSETSTKKYHVWSKSLRKSFAELSTSFQKSFAEFRRQPAEYIKENFLTHDGLCHDHDIPCLSKAILQAMARKAFAVLETCVHYSWSGTSGVGSCTFSTVIARSVRNAAQETNFELQRAAYVLLFHTVPCHKDDVPCLSKKMYEAMKQEAQKKTTKTKTTSPPPSQPSSTDAEDTLLVDDAVAGNGKSATAESVADDDSVADNGTKKTVTTTTTTAAVVAPVVDDVDHDDAVAGKVKTTMAVSNAGDDFVTNNGTKKMTTMASAAPVVVDHDGTKKMMSMASAAPVVVDHGDSVVGSVAINGMKKTTKAAAGPTMADSSTMTKMDWFDVIFIVAVIAVLSAVAPFLITRSSPVRTYRPAATGSTVQNEDATGNTGRNQDAGSRHQYYQPPMSFEQWQAQRQAQRQAQQQQAQAAHQYYQQPMSMAQWQQAQADHRPDLYAILGVNYDDATKFVLHEAYDKLIHQYRPDSLEFRRVKVAYGILSDPVKRFIYDSGY